MNVDAINSLPDGVATDRTPRSTPGKFVASGLSGALFLGPYFDQLGWGTSPYLDWFLETFYIHYRGWAQ